MAEAVRGSNRGGCSVSGSIRARAPSQPSSLCSLPRKSNTYDRGPRAGRRNTSLGKGPVAPKELNTCPCASEEGRSKGRCERGGGTPGAEGARPAAPGRARGPASG